MSENQNIAPPLDMDLNTVDVSLPLLQANEFYDLRIEKAEIKPTAAGGEMIHLDHVTINPARSNKGEPLGAGIHVFNNVNTKPTGKATWDMVKRGMAELVQSVQGGIGTTATLANVPSWVPLLQGKVVRAKVGHEPEGVSKTGKAFKAKNTILFYQKA